MLGSPVASNLTWPQRHAMVDLFRRADIELLRVGFLELDWAVQYSESTENA